MATHSTHPTSYPATEHAREERKFPKHRLLISRSETMQKLETPAHLLESWITPTKHFFVREHLLQPCVNLSEWRLSITGLVEQPLELSYADVKKMESAVVVNTLECAGNGRAFFHPRVSGVSWMRGAVGNAIFSGPRLADLLRRAGVLPGAKHVAFNGIDTATGHVADFVRSIPISKALHADTLLATHMNGLPLTVEHGFPIRALVPG
jgi:sulfite oxidase